MVVMHCRIHYSGSLNIFRCASKINVGIVKFESEQWVDMWNETISVCTRVNKPNILLMDNSDHLSMELKITFIIICYSYLCAESHVQWINYTCVPYMMQQHATHTALRTLTRWKWDRKGDELFGSGGLLNGQHMRARAEALSSHYPLFNFAVKHL